MALIALSFISAALTYQITHSNHLIKYPPIFAQLLQNISIKQYLKIVLDWFVQGIRYQVKIKHAKNGFKIWLHIFLDPGIPVILTRFADLNDVTLADEDNNSIPTDDVNRAIIGNVAIQVVPPGGQTY